MAGWCGVLGDNSDHSAGTSPRRTTLERLSSSELVLDGGRNDLLEATRLGHTITVAAEWLLDNAYLIRTQIAKTKRHKRLAASPLPYVYPDVNDLAAQFVEGSDHALAETALVNAMVQRVAIVL